jgi:hypothetical protein
LSMVAFHATNFSNKILDSSDSRPKANAVSKYTFYTNVSFAPRFAKALRHAVELCGGKPSSF